MLNISATQRIAMNGIMQGQATFWMAVAPRLGRDSAVNAVQNRRGDFNYAWPTAEIAVMGAKGATEIIHRADLDDAEKTAQNTQDYEDRFANPFVAAERGFIDEVIQPRSTRRRVARAFASLRNKPVHTPWKKHDNIPL